MSTALTPRTVTVGDAARLLGISRTLAYEAARTGQLAPGIPVLRVGRRLVVPLAALERALAGYVAATVETPDDAA